MAHKLNITSLFMSDVGQSSLESDCECLYEYSRDIQFIRYADVNEDGGITDVVITVSGGEAVVDRSGANPLCLRLIKGVAFHDEIKTPYGNIPVSYKAKSVSSELHLHGGRLVLEYDMDIGGSLSENTICLDVTI